MKGWDKTDAGCRHDVRPSREILRSFLCPSLFWKLSCSTSDFFFLRSKVFTTRSDEIVMGRLCVSVAHLTILRTFQHIGCYPRLLEARVLRTATGCQRQPLNSSEVGYGTAQEVGTEESVPWQCERDGGVSADKAEAKWGPGRRRAFGLAWVLASILPTHRHLPSSHLR